MAATVAFAAPTPLTPDGTWFDFAVGDVGDIWRSPLDGEPITFTLTSATSFTLRVVDVGFAGDQVDVLLDGTTLLGATAAVATDDMVFAFTPDEAFAAPGTWSQGNWLLAAGTYSFGGTALQSPFGGGNWAISALASTDPSVLPEPGSWGLAFAGLAAVGAARWKRRVSRSSAG